VDVGAGQIGDGRRISGRKVSTEPKQEIALPEGGGFQLYSGAVAGQLQRAGVGSEQEGAFLIIGALGCPDDTITLTAQHCPDCQHDLSNVSVIETKIKQQIELPPVQPFVTEYQLEIKCCLGCAVAQRADHRVLHRAGCCVGVAYLYAYAGDAYFG
jgi:hypothetical protein